MRKATISSSGHIDLGTEAHLAGYRAGMVVRIILLSTGSLLIQLDDEPTIEAPYRRLTAPTLAEYNDVRR